MNSGFAVALEQSFNGTMSIILWLIFFVFIVVMIFMWISVPFILLSIRKELKSINEKLEIGKQEKLD